MIYWTTLRHLLWRSAAVLFAGATGLYSLALLAVVLESRAWTEVWALVLIVVMAGLVIALGVDSIRHSMRREGQVRTQCPVCRAWFWEKMENVHAEHDCPHCHVTFWKG